MEFDKLFAEMLLRWAHILAGIIWLGFAFFLNFVHSHALPALDTKEKASYALRVLKPALYWLRLASMLGLILGAVLFFFHHHGLKTYTPMDGSGLNGRGRFIMWGMTFGGLLWFNVWFLLRGAQNRIVTALVANEQPAAGDLGRARLFANLGLYLAGPMLMLMVMANQLGGFSYAYLGFAMVVGVATIQILIVLSKRAVR